MASLRPFGPGDQGSPPLIQSFPMARVGLLAQRPAVADVPVNFQYWASDDQGGTEYISNGTTWVAGPSLNTATGRILGRAKPATVATLAINSTGVRVPELTTPAFTMPAVPCTITMGQLGVNDVAVAGLAYALRYTTDGWSTSFSCGSQGETSFASLNSKCAGMVLPLERASTQTAPAAGATVQVGLFLSHPSDVSVTPAVLAGFDVVTIIEVRAG